MKKLLWIGVFLGLMTSCWIGLSVDEQRRRDRLRDADKMYREVQRVRKKCVPMRKRVGGPKKHVYYS